MDKTELKREMQKLKAEIKRLRASLAELSQPLSVLLKRRGFTIYKREPAEDLLLPEDGSIDGYYSMLRKYPFRLFLRDVIKHRQFFTPKDVTRYATREIAEKYIDYLINTGIAEKSNDSFKLKKQRVKSFGPTLEWFMAEIFKREFSAEAIWGIKFKRPGVGGDYDLIARVDNSILYMEIKSSPPKQIYPSEIAAFLGRVSDLLPDIALFFMDTELRMKDKIVPMFEDEFRKAQHDSIQALLKACKISGPPEIKRMEKELFHIQNKTFIINAKDGIAGNIEKVLTSYFRNTE